MHTQSIVSALTNKSDFQQVRATLGQVNGLDIDLFGPANRLYWSLELIGRRSSLANRAYSERLAINTLRFGNRNEVSRFFKHYAGPTSSRVLAAGSERVGAEIGNGPSLAAISEALDRIGYGRHLKPGFLEGSEQSLDDRDTHIHRKSVAGSQLTGWASRAEQDLYCFDNESGPVTNMQLTQRALLRKLKDCATPFAFVRVSDGEGAILGAKNASPESQEALREQLMHWLGESLEPWKSGFGGEGLIRSLQSAQVIAIPTEDEVVANSGKTSPRPIKRNFEHLASVLDSHISPENKLVVRNGKPSMGALCNSEFLNTALSSFERVIVVSPLAPRVIHALIPEALCLQVTLHGMYSSLGFSIGGPWKSAGTNLLDEILRYKHSKTAVVGAAGVFLKCSAHVLLENGISFFDLGATFNTVASRTFDLSEIQCSSLQMQNPVLSKLVSRASSRYFC